MARQKDTMLTKRQEFLLFLKGAFAAVHGGYIPPVSSVARSHFMEGQYAVDRGNVVVPNMSDAQDFIDRVERGLWPPLATEDK